MRKYLLSSAAALILALGPAAAQVSVDPRALDALKPGAAAPSPKSAPPKTPVRPAPRAPAKPAVAKPVAPAPIPPPPAPPPPVIPAAPPPVPVLPPPVTVPVRPAPQPLPATVTADAPGAATAIGDGIRVTFGSGRSDLNPSTLEALRGLAHSAAPSSVFNLTAFAAGSADDPSSPRRLSLARALTVRSVLISQGFASPRIYVRALGATTPAAADGPADRVDVVVSSINPATSTTSGPQPQAKSTP